MRVHTTGDQLDGSCCLADTILPGVHRGAELTNRLCGVQVRCIPPQASKDGPSGPETAGTRTEEHESSEHGNGSYQTTCAVCERRGEDCTYRYSYKKSGRRPRSMSNLAFEDNVLTLYQTDIYAPGHEQIA